MQGVNPSWLTALSVVQDELLRSKEKGRGTPQPIAQELHEPVPNQGPAAEAPALRASASMSAAPEVSASTTGTTL
jgi:hypothetical protein